MISVEKVAADQWRVTVDAATTSVHEVQVPPEFYARLTDARCSVETLLVKSFEFLLERESNTSILRAFELPVISRYFPEYESVIAGELP